MTVQVFRSSEPGVEQVFVLAASDIRAVKQTSDGQARLLLDNGSEIGVHGNALAIVAGLTPPPSPPAFVANTSNLAAIALTGTAEPGAVVSVRDGAMLLLTAKADTLGAWEATLALSPGEHTVVATQTNIFGNTSAPSAPCSLNIPVPPPPPPPEPQQPAEVQAAAETGAGEAGETGAAEAGESAGTEHPSESETA